MAEHHLARQAEGEAELAHLVLEELAQRLEQLEVERLGQPAHVVVRLDGLRLLAARIIAGAGRFDYVRVNRPLREPARISYLGRLPLKNFDEQPPDNLSLLLGIRDTAQGGEEFL